MLPKHQSFFWKAGSFRIKLSGKALIMGIVNVTPDSFSGDGVLAQYSREKVRGLSHALQLADQGADILDIGGESSRPGALTISPEDEAARVVPLIKALVKRVKVPLTVDTFKPFVARQALEAGASAVNLIKGTEPDESMLDIVRKFKAGLFLMHMRGTPANMQTMTKYKDVVLEVREQLRKAVKACLCAGIKKDNLIIDPGIGFSKTTGQNLLLLKHLKKFTSLGFPILVGPSRKSFIGNTLMAGLDDRLPGTLASAVVAATAGANILRVHDVKEIKQAISMAYAIYSAE
ncbi:MAG: dihydropteroate synthase [Candidatus Omnitrophota bacterium]